MLELNRIKVEDVVTDKTYLVKTESSIELIQCCNSEVFLTSSGILFKERIIDCYEVIESKGVPFNGNSTHQEDGKESSSEDL